MLHLLTKKQLKLADTGAVILSVIGLVLAAIYTFTS